MSYTEGNSLSLVVLHVEIDQRDRKFIQLVDGERPKFGYPSGLLIIRRGLDFTSHDRPFDKTTPVIVVMHGLTGGMSH